MEARHAVVLVLLFCGLAAFLLSAVALLVLPGPYQRLHALTPATSLGQPLLVAALAVDTGPGGGQVPGDRRLGGGDRPGRRHRHWPYRHGGVGR